MRQIIFLNEISSQAKMRISELQEKIRIIDNSDMSTAQKNSAKRPILKEIRQLKSGLGVK